jgi:hypothetical protein
MGQEYQPEARVVFDKQEYTLTPMVLKQLRFQISDFDFEHEDHRTFSYSCAMHS